MQFAQPWLLLTGAVGAALITALHFLSVRTPPELLLPTARFLDEGEVRAVSRSARPSDLLLLLLRVAALLLAAAALAGPRWLPARSQHLVLVVADAAWRRDSTALDRVLGRNASTATSTTVTRFVWSDSLDGRRQPGGLRVDVAAAIPLALRAASQHLSLLPAVDSVSLQVVLPRGRDAASLPFDDDGAWRGWRAQWPGAIRLYGDFARGNDADVRLRFDSVSANDPVRAALAMQGGRASSTAGLRLVAVQRQRGQAPASDSASVTIVWPRDGAPAGWAAAHDSADAVVAEGVALVAAWPRTVRAPVADGQAPRPIAWWNDGEVAAIERARGATCVREVGVPLTGASDLLLDVNARGLLRALVAPCATRASDGPGPPVLLRVDTLGSARAAVASAFHVNDTEQSASRTIELVLLGAALLCLAVETVVRARAVAAVGSSAAESRRAVRPS